MGSHAVEVSERVVNGNVRDDEKEGKPFHRELERYTGCWNIGKYSPISTEDGLAKRDAALEMRQAGKHYGV